jgi:hypothetical protein
VTVMAEHGLEFWSLLFHDLQIDFLHVNLLIELYGEFG